MKQVLKLFGFMALTLSTWAMPAADLALIFDEDRTEANRSYRGKETVVAGSVTGMLREGGSDYRIVLDNAAAIMLNMGDELHAEAIAALLAAIEEEEERLDEAREWAHDYKRRFQKYGGRYRGRRMKRYSDELNPEGPTEKQLELVFYAGGICKGVRGGHVLLDPVAQISTSALPRMAPAQKRKAAAALKAGAKTAQAKAMEKTSWVLKGKVYCEHGQRYFAPSPDQFGVDFWSITVPSRVGDFAVVPAVNGKAAVLEADFKPAKRGTRGIAAQHVKLKSLKLDK